MKNGKLTTDNWGMKKKCHWPVFHCRLSILHWFSQVDWWLALFAERGYEKWLQGD